MHCILSANYCVKEASLQRLHSYESTRPFKYDLNQIPYDYTVEVINRFKGLGLVDGVPENLRTEVCNTV